MSKPKQTILPQDFPLPGPGGRHSREPVLTSMNWPTGLTFVFRVLMFFIRPIFKNLVAILAMPLLSLGIAWWVYPTQVSAFVKLISGLDQWASWLR